MDKIDKMYYINLNRRPDRNEHFLNECNKANIPKDKIARFEALDGTTYQFNENETNLFNRVDFKGAPYEKKIMGNQMSHFYILKEMIEKNYEYIIIFQDDVIFRNNFLDYLTKVMDSIPDNAEIINIGIQAESCYSHFVSWDFIKDNDILDKLGTKYNDNICILNYGAQTCSLSYIVTKQGAKNLVEYFEKIGFLRSTDHNFNDYLNKQNIFYGSSTVLCTGNAQLGTDIW